MSLINSSKEFTEYDKFINILENEFSRKYVIILFGGQILLICRELIELILKIKKDDEAILKSSCFVHFISDGNEIIKICSVCFIKIIEKKNLLKHFKVKQKIKDETHYFYL